MNPLELGQVRVYTDVFTAAELRKIREAGDAAELIEGRADYAPTPDIRKCLVAWLHTQWIAKRCAEVVSTINEEHFGFHIEAIREPLQYARYGEGEHFGWHVDMAPANHRKLSLTVQLSEPDEYEGGELLMQIGALTVTMDDSYGAVIAFPSWVPHRVMPVTKGVRRSLVIWAHGPPFR